VAGLILRGVLALALVSAGWIAAKAQISEPDFELIVDAPAGETTIECVRGCGLMWVERGVNPNGSPSPTFTFRCEGGNVQRCSSSRVGGWIDR
jgi:hypothetical protein